MFFLRSWLEKGIRCTAKLWIQRDGRNTRDTCWRTLSATQASSLDEQLSLEKVFKTDSKSEIFVKIKEILELKKGHEKLGTGKCIYMYKNISLIMFKHKSVK